MKVIKYVVIMILISQGAAADCASDCKKVTDAADKVIAEQKQELDLYKQKDVAQTQQIVDLSTSLSEKTESLNAWYHNPYIITGLGIIIGFGTATYLDRR